MAKDLAISKKIKISKAQQYMMLAALGSGIIFGVCLSLVVHSVTIIEFNARVLKEEDIAIKAYSKTIENIGVCPKPKNNVYTEDELKKCNPDTLSLSSVSGTLRANILDGLAANKSLSSVPTNTSEDNCFNPETNKRYTYDELNEEYDQAVSEEDIKNAMSKIKSCSALRILSDALPSQKNEEALLASLDNIFYISDWRPESLTPSGHESDYEGISGLNSIMVTVPIEAKIATTKKILSNIERSIREFDIETASLEWKGDNLALTMQARAYYVDEAELVKVTKTIKANPNKQVKGKK